MTFIIFRLQAIKDGLPLATAARPQNGKVFLASAFVDATGQPQFAIDTDEDGESVGS